MEKWQFAPEMVDSGKTNEVIVAALKAKFGKGISTTKLAEWRATTMDRMATNEKSGRKKMRADKRKYIRKCLIAGLSSYATQQACAQEFGEGCGYDTIMAVQKEVAGDAEAEAAKAEEAIVTVEIPDEVREDEPVESTALAPTVPPPNGSLTDLKAVQAWMKKINAEELTLTDNGDLSMLVRHKFNLGEAE